MYEIINKFYFIEIIISNYYIIYKFFIMGIGDWGLGIGDWGLGVGRNSQSPIPHPQSPIPH